ncbi:hypothetical protein ACIGCK_04755 [Microbacterium sp. NPDC078428]|uniref:hypothetical protein n=1 Tax=Microbacterium sp. NPDC078428 TaxID=3364190 RepID=UPI0037C8FC9F
MITTTIDLGGLAFEDETRAGWAFSALTDWWGQVDDKTPVTERPQGHGAFPVSRSLRSSRAMAFRAVYVGASQAALENAVDELSAIGAEGPVRMTVTTPAGATWRTVSVEATPFEDHRGRKNGAVAVDLVARDSRRYADAEWVSTAPPDSGGGLVWPVVWPAVWPGGGSPGRVALVNSGRAPSAPMFRLLGGFSSALITCVETGERIGFDRPIPVGSTVDIDVAGRRAMIDGQSDVSRWLRWREWGDVPPLSTRRFQFDVAGPSGSPMLQGRVFPAWW